MSARPVSARPVSARLIYAIVLLTSIVAVSLTATTGASVSPAPRPSESTGAAGPVVNAE